MSIPNAFIKHASDILGNTENGFSTSQILELCSEFSFRYDVKIPYVSLPLPSNVPNKRSALYKNLVKFEPEKQFTIISELCNDSRVSEQEEVKSLKIILLTRYGTDFGSLDADEVNISLVTETKHWLEAYPGSQRLYLEATMKLEHNVFNRNLLDDLRLSLESLLKAILSNGRTLENNKAEIGRFLRNKNISAELRNMIVSLIGYYCDYQNSYVKHNDNVNEKEIIFIFELTSTLMKTLVQLV
jgi:hypothetical protein